MKPFLFVVSLLLAAPASAQSVLTHLDKSAAFGKDAMGATMWPQELDGDPRTREALLVRVNAQEQMEYLPVGICASGQIRRGAWVEPFILGWPSLPDEWFVVGWIVRAGDRDVYAMQGLSGYVEITFDLPACAARRPR